MRKTSESKWKKLKNRQYDWDDIRNSTHLVVEGDMIMAIYGQGEDTGCPFIKLVVGRLKEIIERSDGCWNWMMGKHILFSQDPHYGGGHAEYIIKPPGKDVYCPAGFQSFTGFSYPKLRDGLSLMGYKDVAIDLGVYAVECVFESLYEGGLQ